MNHPDSELLKRYSGQGDEAAFTELVTRYTDLVFSAALRQALQDAADAEEITQRVFTDLAWKASTLQGHSSLSGWLYSSTRLAALEFRRAETRRRARETHFAAMNEPEPVSTPNPEWDQISPLLDGAMADLSASDREAVLWRYFERRPLAEVGQRLGLTEDAARMRIHRALEKLQTILGKRGILSTSAALGVALGQHAIASAPAGLVARVGGQALKGRLCAPELARRRNRLGVGGPAVTAVVMVTMIAGLGFLYPGKRSHGPGDLNTASAGASASGVRSGVPRLRTSEETRELIFASSPVSEFDGESVLVLQVFAKESGKAIPGAIIGQTLWTSPSYQGMSFKRIAADHSGVAWIHIPTNVHRVRLTSRTDGFVDTQMRWDVINGEQVPTNYVVSLDRAPLIGGHVVDSRDQPVADAEVVVQYDERPSDRHGIESHAYGQVKALTDAEGRWNLARIAPEMIEQSRISAGHTEHQPAEPVNLPGNPDAVVQLRNRSHVLRLAAASTLQGVVTDMAGHVLSNALVSVRRPTMRETRTTASGEFVLPGCPAGNHWLHAEAPGFRAQLVAIRSPLKTEPLRIQLEPGATIRVRVADARGGSISNAWFAFTGLPESDKTDPDMPPRPLPTEFIAYTDGEGRAEWTNAPATGAVFDFIAMGYEPLRNIRLAADGTEHPIAMQAEVHLTLEGTVTDAQDHTPVPTFRIAVGAPMPNPFQEMGTPESAMFLENDSTWQQYAGGHFRHAFSKEELRFAHEARVMIRAEADGYEPWLSKVIESNAGEVHLQIELQKAVLHTLTVKAADGSPAAGAELGVVRGSESLWLLGTQFSRQRGVNPANLFRADAAGTATIRIGARDGRVLMIHASGYAERSFESLTTDAEVRLIPWSRIDVQFEAVDSGAMEADVIPGESLSIPLRLEWETMHATADVNGRCSFRWIPPGNWVVRQLRPMARVGGGGSWQPGDQKRVQLADGKSASVRLGGGCSIKGRFQAPDGAVLPATDWRMGRIKWGVSPPIPPGLKPWSAAFVEWRQRPEIRRQFDEIQWHSREFLVNPDGTFIADGVEPGSYQLSWVTSADKLALKAEQPLIVPEVSAHGMIDLGTIPLTLVHR